MDINITKRIGCFAAALCLLFGGCAQGSGSGKVPEETRVSSTFTTAPKEVTSAAVTSTALAEVQTEAKNEKPVYNYFENVYFIGDSVAEGAVRDGYLSPGNSYINHFSERLKSAGTDGTPLTDLIAVRPEPYIYLCVGDGDIMADVSPGMYADNIRSFVEDIKEARPDAVITVLGGYKDAKEHNEALEKAITGFVDTNIHYVDISLAVTDWQEDALKEEYKGADGTLNSDGIRAVFEMLYKNRYSDVLAENAKLRFMYPEITADAPERTVTDDKVAYLTFDDGPSDHTEEILDILSEYDIKATFFITGRSVGGREDIIKREKEEGHVLGLHSYTHDYDLIYGSAEDFMIDFYRVYERVTSIVGDDSIWCFRYPGGSYNKFNKTTADTIISEMNRRGFAYFDWNCATLDAEKGSDHDSCVKTLKESAVYNHSVVLMHDASPLTPGYLREVIDHLISEGYSFETVATAPDMHFRRPSWFDEEEDAEDGADEDSADESGTSDSESPEEGSDSYDEDDG